MIQAIHGGPVEKDNEPKTGRDPVLDIAEFFERIDRRYPRKPTVKTSFPRRPKP